MTDIRRICVLYFSPTGGTEKAVRLIAGELAYRLKKETVLLNLTRPENRRATYRFDDHDLVLAASPVYAGRLPNKLLEDYRAWILGGGRTPVVPICVFGNRSPGEAVRELVLLLEGNGFFPIGAAAFAGRHAFSDAIGKGRPDSADQAQMRSFAAQLAEKLSRETPLKPLEIGRSEIGPYYTPLKEDGTPAKFLKAKPLTDAGKCTQCGACVHLCPMGSIDPDTMEAAGICIKCQACVRGCPTGAKHFADTDFLSHVAMLERDYTRRAENMLFL